MKTIKPLNLYTLKVVILVLFCLSSLNALGQGIPKAYEEIHYRGKVNGEQVKFTLANGYIGASLIRFYTAGHNRPVAFQRESGTADEQRHLKFIATQGNVGYFIIDNMQEAYEDPPTFIAGRYFSKGQKLPIKLVMIRSRSRQRRS